jgi:hypothetical protein
MGKALFDNAQVSLCLNRGVFKALLGETAEDSYSDLEEFKHIDFNVSGPKI